MEKVAKISKLYGADGEAVINLFSNFPAEFSLSEPIFIRVDSLSVPLYFDSFQRRGHSSAVVKFADIDTERRIMEFMGADLLLPELAQEEIDDEFFMEDLVGFRVEIIDEQDKEQGALPEQLSGELSQYIHSEANPLFEVLLGGREVLIPAVEEFIHSIDFDHKIIRFILPEGLLNL